MIDFIPLITAFAATLVGIIGNTWDKQKRGIRRLTRIGFVVVGLGLISLGYGIWTIRDKNRQISDVARVKQIAYDEVFEGLDYLLLHLADRELREMQSNGEILRRLRDPSYLEKLGQDQIVDVMKTGTVTDALPGPGFTHPYQLYDYDIDRGEKLLDDVLIKYSRLLEPETIVRINAVLRDDFFRRKYKLSQNQVTLDLAIDAWKRTGEVSPWGTLGLYYFNAVYSGPAKRPGKYDDYLTFMNQIEALVRHINALQNKKSVLLRNTL